MAINAEHSHAYAILVARRVAKCISAYSAKVDTGFATGIRADYQNRAFSCGKPESGLPQENARRKNDDAGTEARVIDSNLKKDSSARAAWTGARTATAAARTAALGARTGAKHRLRLHRQQPFALQLLAGELASAAYGFRLFAGFLLGGFFIMAAELHLAENSLALHFLLQRLEGLIDIVIANENLHAASSFN